MLTELYIKNFAIIDDLRIPFSEGLNILTGETGAGKSIIIEALGLVLGDRASGDIVRSGEDEAQVVAVFDAKNIANDLVKDLKERGCLVDDQLIVKRAVLTSGRSKAYINGQPISVGELRGVSKYLLEIASQHEHQRLLSEDVHLEIVDKFGGFFVLKEEFSEKYQIYCGLRNRLAELETLSVSKAEQKEFLSYQVGEIDSANLSVGEDKDLERERNLVKHASKLLEKVNTSARLLYSSEDSVAARFAEVRENLKSAAEIDPDTKEWADFLNEAEVAVDELSRGLQNYLDKLDVDPSRLDEIESRLFEVKRLKKKYGETVEEILAKRDELVGRLDLIENCDHEIEQLSKEITRVRSLLEKAAKKLSAARLKAANELSLMIQKELDTLGLKKVTFAPGHEKLDLDSADGTGVDRFNFLISTNPGEPLKLLSKIASGGELSRIMLAIKTVLIDRIGLATLEVFDEVDVGIGGGIAEVVGRKLKEMSRKKQIICITHLPQVACFGDNHLVVSKESKGERLVTRFKLLKDADRVSEIARMLGGTKITATTLKHAGEMLERG